MTETHTTAALNKLAVSAANVRRFESDAGIEELAASIAAHGLLHPLTVRKAQKGRYEVIAGSRRLKALKRLAANGTLPKTHPVPVLIVEGSTDTEISLTENLSRANMHPVDEIEAFRSMSAEGLRAEDIAARFGLSHMTVRRRLKLVALSPRLLDEMRENRLDLQQAEALVLTASHAEQEQVWFDAPEWQRESRHLRSRLTQEKVSASSNLGRFVASEYSGPIEEDLFSDDDERYFTDREEVDRIALAKLNRLAEALQGEGWKWIDAVPSFQRYNSGLKWLQPATRILDAERHEAISIELEQVATELESRGIYGSWSVESDEDRELWDRKKALEAELRALEVEEYSDEQKAVSGVVVTVGQEGFPAIERGLQLPEDVAESARKAAGKESERADAATEAKPTLSAALITDLTGERTAALAVHVANQPKIALALTVFSLHKSRSSNWSDNVADLVARPTPQVAPAVKETMAYTCFAEVLGSLNELPKDDAELWQHLITADETTLLRYLAILTASSLNAVDHGFTGDKKRLANADRVAAAVGLDMRYYWQPHPAYFKRVSKAAMAEAITESGIKNADRIAASIAKMTKAEAVEATARALEGSGWLPVPLRNSACAEADETALAA